jgi:hypothetical protein
MIQRFFYTTCAIHVAKYNDQHARWHLPAGRRSSARAISSVPKLRRQRAAGLRAFGVSGMKPGALVRELALLDVVLSPYARFLAQEFISRAVFLLPARL